MKRLNVNTSIESFLVMLLMTIFAVSVSFIIIEGKSTFERVTENKIQDENARIAMSYVNKRIKQNDESDGISVVEDAVEGLTALKISQQSYEEGLFTYIFYHKGIMYECYTDIEPTIQLSTEIIPVSNLSFEESNGQIIMKLDYEYQGEMIPIEQKTSLRSKGDHND
ncbi:MAG: DUF4860 domain-containing protein [Clostridiales bacterium]|nr:DUF4860 domain-containing protein [Clostridiales bacterium]